MLNNLFFCIIINSTHVENIIKVNIFMRNIWNHLYKDREHRKFISPVHCPFTPITFPHTWLCIRLSTEPIVSHQPLSWQQLLPESVWYQQFLA